MDASLGIRVRVKRRAERVGGSQWMTLAAAGAEHHQSGLNQLRYATLKGIMAARRGIERSARPQPRAPPKTIVSVYLPERARDAVLPVRSRDAKSLVQKLRDEAR